MSTFSRPLVLTPLLSILLGLGSACSPRSECAQACVPGQVCVDGECLAPCNVTSECPSDLSCIGGLCRVGSGAPHISNVVGAGAAPGRFRDRLIVHGQRLASAEVHLQGNGHEMRLSVEEEADDRLLVALQSSLTPGAYTLSVVNTAGSATASVTLMAEPRTADELQEMLKGLDGPGSFADFSPVGNEGVWTRLPLGAAYRGAHATLGASPVVNIQFASETAAGASLTLAPPPSAPGAVLTLEDIVLEFGGPTTESNAPTITVNVFRLAKVNEQEPGSPTYVQEYAGSIAPPSALMDRFLVRSVRHDFTAGASYGNALPLTIDPLDNYTLFVKWDAIGAANGWLWGVRALWKSSAE